jgi:hypothetical protein
VAYLIWFFSAFQPAHEFNFGDWMIALITAIIWGIVYSIPGAVICLVTGIGTYQILKGFKR